MDKTFEQDIAYSAFLLFGEVRRVGGILWTYPLIRSVDAAVK